MKKGLVSKAFDLYLAPEAFCEGCFLRLKDLKVFGKASGSLNFLVSA